MTATRSGPGDWAKSIGAEARNLLGLVRRMTLSLTSRALWQVTGHLLLDKRVEAHDVEAFTGVGFYARPKAGNRVDAIVIFPDGAAYPVAIAFRDQDTWKKVASDLAEGETQIHNDECVVRMKADGTIEARAYNGAATKLPTFADVETIRNQVNNHAHGAGTYNAPSGGGPVTGNSGAAPAVTAPVGTTKFKAQ